MKAEEIIVRKATMADLEALLSMCAKLVLHDSQFDSDLDIAWDKTEDAHKFFQDRIKNEDGIVLVAEIKNQFAGYLIGGLIEPLPFRKIKIVAELEEIFVDENYRRYAIGSMLSKKFYSWCKAAKAEKIEVAVYARNQRAIEFYKKKWL